MLHCFSPQAYSLGTAQTRTSHTRVHTVLSHLCLLKLSACLCSHIRYSQLKCKLPDSVQFSLSVVSSSLRSHESQHTRPPCPSPTPGVHSDSRPSSWRCHPAISSSVVPFSSCLQSLPASESFPMSQLFARGGHFASHATPVCYLASLSFKHSTP